MINDLDIVQWAYLLDPAFQLVNSAGKPLTDGWIEVYIHGTRNKYYCASDFDGTLHPFKIPLDSLGSNIVLASPDYAYDIYIYNKFGSLVMSRYNVVAGKGGGGSGGIPSSTEAQHWLGQYGATQALIGNETGQTLALPSRPDYQGDFVDHIDYGLINGDEVNQYPKYMYLKPGLYLVNCVIRFQQQHGTEVNRLDETLVYTGNGNANEDIAWQLDETGPLATGDRHCLKLTFIRKVLDEDETSTVDCSNILYFAPAPSVNWNDAYIQTLQIVKLNSAVQGGGVQQLLKPGEGISIDEENVISVTGMQPASGMDQYVTVINFNDYITEVTEVINNVTGDIINIQNEIDAVSASVSAIVPEYQEGYGIVIEGDTISVDPSIIPSGCVSQEELAQVSGDIVNQIENVTGDVTEITNVINNVTGDVTNLTEVVEGATGDITNIITEISNVTGDIVNINENVTNLTEVVNNVTGDVTNLTEVVNNVTGDIQNITNVVENVTGDINNLETIVNNVTGDVTNLTTIVGDVTGDITNLTEIVNNVTGDIQNISGDVNNLTTVVEGVTGDIQNITGDIEQLNIDIQAVSAAVSGGTFEQVQSDWTQDDDTQVDYIKNKPDETEVVAGTGISIVENGNIVTISATGQATQQDLAQVNADIQTVSAAIPDISNLATKDEVNVVEQDVQTVSSAIPTDVVTHTELAAVTGDYATNSDLQIVSAAVDSVSASLPETEEVEFEELDVSNFATNSQVTAIESEIETVSSAIPTDVVTHAELANVTGDYATNEDLQIVSAAIPDVSNFATEAELQAVSAGIPEAQVNADWEATSGKAEILNKPQEVAVHAGDGISITVSGNDVTIAATNASVSADIARLETDIQTVSSAIPTDVVTHQELAGVTGDYATNSDLQTVSAAVDAVSANIPETEEVEFEELDLSQFVTESAVTGLEADIQTVSSAIPTDVVTHQELAGVTGDYATNADLQIVSAAIPDVSNLATNADLQTVSGAVDAVSANIPSQIEVEFKELDISQFLTESAVTGLEADIQTVSSAIPTDTVTHAELASVTGDYATNADLQTVSAAIPDVSNLATKQEMQFVSGAVDAVSANIPETEEVEFEELDLSQYVTESAVTGLEADIQTVSAAIPDVSNFATEAELQAVSAGIPEAQVQSDWTQTATGSPDFIRNKPSEVNLVAGANITIIESGNNLIIASQGGGGGSVTGDYVTHYELAVVTGDIQSVSAAVDSVSGQIPESEEVEFEELDLTEYATVSQVTAVEADVQIVSAAIPDVSNLATKTELQTVSAAIPDVSNLATKTELQTVSAAIPDVSNLATKTEVGNVEADVQTVSAAIPDVSNFATESELQTVSAAIPDVSNLASKSEVSDVAADVQTVSAAIPDVSNFITQTAMENYTIPVQVVASSAAATGNDILYIVTGA